jgi:hypothetical protein
MPTFHERAQLGIDEGVPVIVVVSVTGDEAVFKADDILIVRDQ